MDEKNSILKKNITYIFFFKLISVLFVYLSVPLLIDALGVDNYGIWITVYSIFGWIYLLDLGLNNGLKNKLTIAFLKKENEVNEYITTSYICLACLAIVFFLISSLLIYFINLGNLLNIPLEEWYIKTLFFITLISFVIIFILSIYKQFFYALQKSSIVELSMMIYNGLVLLLLYLFFHYSKSSLITTTIIYGASNILICIIFTYIFFKNKNEYTFSFKNFKFQKIKELSRISVGFFIIQICVLIILSTDNLLVIILLGPTEVTSYNNAFKLFQLFLIVSTIIHAPLWALYTDAYHKKDFKWIKKTMLRLNVLFIILILFVALTIYLGPEILALWIKEDIFYDPKLLLFMGLFVIVRIFGEIYITFLNGIGKIKIQLIVSISAAIINIPLSIIFVKYFDLGNSGIILATVISISIYAIAMPIQAFSILRKKNIV
ncbi:oligosaccharide flippase family protein [Aureibaculum sp. A20]|uniref:Oligosaccharide flippase family protein n=1 Tax=Aureibaculum flavum TaxID=2795986 RepID=A0ABS0WQP3_9FLAO|nr:oligosaccharide flippase family protein [Aureibaculum flavum]MBJ2174281.1 oligosaccharide flippase family protein [Aureibaculum flavum]